MGINIHCACMQGNRDIVSNTARLKRDYTHEENKENIILIQSIFRGYIFREHLKENLKYQLLKKSANLQTNSSLKYNYIRQIDINKIFEQYPMINNFKDMNLITMKFMEEEFNNG